MPRQRIGADPISPAERQARTSSEAARAQPSLVDTSRAGATQGSPRATSGETPVANRTVGDGSGDAVAVQEQYRGWFDNPGLRRGRLVWGFGCEGRHQSRP